MTQTINQLSHNGISSLIKENQEQESIIVQIIDFQFKKQKFYIIISDGNFTIKALPKDQTLLDPTNDINAIIVIKGHMTGKNNIVGIVDYEKIFNYKCKIGNPIQFDTNTINPQNIQTYNLQKSMINLKIQSETIKKINELPTAQKTAQPLKKTVPPVATNKPLNGKLTDFQTIKGLYIGMDRWTIVCRIVKIDYNQFISKKTGKQTKVLNIELMDRTGMKISGVFFGQAAQTFRDRLVKDRVYQISQGQIRQQSYNNSKNQKMSPFKLNFTNLSKFQEVSDTNSIAKNEDAAITLGDCVERRVLGQQFDVICILIKIQQTVQVKKQDGLLKKTNLLIADPIKNLTIHAVLWNQNIIPDPSLIGKSIILSRFKLSQYKGSLTLGSIYRSAIIPVSDHHYQQYQSKAMNQYNEYEKLHEIKAVVGMEQEHTVCSTFKQLEQKIQNLNSQEWARGDFTVFINKFGLKKWHYDGCPYCDKAAQSLSSCNHCQKYVQKTVGHFIMSIQICDATGSLWTTAYDEFAKKIFNVSDQNSMIQYLSKLEANQLKQQTQSYLYQEFRLRITSRKDKEGRIKHHVSKVYDRDYISQTIRNIQLINKLQMF